MRTIEFETPENVRISYEAAGLGQRFIAWLIDQIIVGFISLIAIVVLVIALISAGILSDSAAEIGDRLESAQGDPQASEEIAKYFIGGTIVV
ncbi:MAG: RDD family protein, partial [Planctomycetaceae bacterium]|nr:RDD family protein [Planctomycetaceae bacterium]